MRALFPLGDVDLLDAYHLCGGRVVTFCAPGTSRRPPASEEVPSTGRGGVDDRYPYHHGPGYRCTKRGLPGADGVGAGSSRRDNDDDDAAVRDDGSAERAAGWELGQREEEVRMRRHATLAAAAFIFSS